MDTKYNVGQVLFAIDGKRFSITPYQIIEHHVKTSLDGTENSYFAVSARTKESINLSTLRGPLFESVEDAGNYLTQVAGERIKKLVEDAERISNEIFQFESENPKNEPVNLKNKDQDIVVELPDGRQAKLSKGGSYEDFSG